MRLLVLAGLMTALPPTVLTVLAAVLGSRGWWVPAAIFLLLLVVAIHDVVQRRHSVLRNVPVLRDFPVLGRMRFLLEKIRPEIQQHFIELTWDGTPFDRDQRSLTCCRATGLKGDQAFGTERDVNAPGCECFVPSVAPQAARRWHPRARPEDEPGTTAGAQYTVRDPAPESHDVDPDDTRRGCNPGLARGRRDTM